MNFRVVIANDHAYVAGGASEVAIQEAVLLAGAGLEVWFVACAGPADERLEKARIRIVLTGQKELKEKATLVGAWEGIWNKRGYQAIARLPASESPTILHVHSFSKALTASVFVAARARGWKVVASLHDYFCACPNGGYYNFQSQSICRLKGMSAACFASHCDRRSRLQKLYRYTKSIVQRMAGVPSTLDAVITLSSLSESVMDEQLQGIPRFRLTNPSAMKQSAPVRIERNQGVLYIGQLNAEKGCLLAARAAQQAGWPITFVGDGPLRAAIQAENPAAKIAGWLPRTQIQPLLDQARALIFPSRWYEVQPLVPLEAMARGLPVIVSGCSAARDYVTDRANGLIVSDENAQSWVDALRHLEDNATAERIGRAAYDWFWQKWPPETQHVTSLIEIYRRVLAVNVAP